LKTTHAAAADQAATATPDNPLRYVPLVDIVESCTHVQRARRARYSDQGLDELAESINRSGVLQPILVRPFNGSNVARSSDGEPPSFEIVAGERRFLASKRAGLRQIPAIVRELTDEHVLEAQLVENLQREDLDALSEAEGYDELMRVARIDVDQVAAKIGKSRSYVYARTKLLDLSDEGRAALAAGKLDASRALLVARIADPKRQAKALELALDYQGERPRLSYRDLLREIGRKNASVALSTATFPLDDPTLAPGPCTTCAFRSGNCSAPGVTEDPDVCNDVRCFNTKTRAASDRRLKAAEAAGRPIIKGDAAVELLKSSKSFLRVNNLAGYVDLDSVCDDDEFPEPEPKATGDQAADDAAMASWQDRWNAHKPRTYRELLGNDAAPTAAFVDPKTRRTLELMPVDEVRRLLQAKGIELSEHVGAVAGPSMAHDPKAHAAAQAKERARIERLQAYRQRIAQEVFPKATEALDAAELALVAKSLGSIWPAAQILPTFYGGKPLPGSMKAGELARYIRFALLAHELLSHNAQGRAPMLEGLAKHHGVDVAKIKAELEGKGEKPSKASSKKAPAKKAAAKTTAKPKPKAAPAKKATKVKASKVKQ